MSLRYNYNKILDVRNLIYNQDKAALAVGYIQEERESSVDVVLTVGFFVFFLNRTDVEDILKLKFFSNEQYKKGKRCINDCIEETYEIRTEGKNSNSIMQNLSSDMPLDGKMSAMINELSLFHFINNYPVFYSITQFEYQSDHDYILYANFYTTLFKMYPNLEDLVLSYLDNKLDDISDLQGRVAFNKCVLPKGVKERLEYPMTYYRKQIGYSDKLTPDTKRSLNYVIKRVQGKINAYPYIQDRSFYAAPVAFVDNKMIGGTPTLEYRPSTDEFLLTYGKAFFNKDLEQMKVLEKQETFLCLKHLANADAIHKLECQNLVPPSYCVGNPNGAEEEFFYLVRCFSTELYEDCNDMTRYTQLPLSVIERFIATHRIVGDIDTKSIERENIKVAKVALLKPNYVISHIIFDFDTSWNIKDYKFVWQERV